MGIEVRDIVMKRWIFFGMSTNSSRTTGGGEASAVRAAFWVGMSTDSSRTTGGGEATAVRAVFGAFALQLWVWVVTGGCHRKHNPGSGAHTPNPDTCLPCRSGFGNRYICKYVRI